MLINYFPFSGENQIRQLHPLVGFFYVERIKNFLFLISGKEFPANDNWKFIALIYFFGEKRNLKCVKKYSASFYCMHMKNFLCCVIWYLRSSLRYKRYYKNLFESITTNCAVGLRKREIFSFIFKHKIGKLWKFFLQTILNFDKDRNSFSFSNLTYVWHEQEVEEIRNFNP